MKYKLRLDFVLEALDDVEVRPKVASLLRSLGAECPRVPKLIRLVKEAKPGPLEDTPENILARPSWVGMIPESMVDKK